MAARFSRGKRIVLFVHISCIDGWRIFVKRANSRWLMPRSSSNSASLKRTASLVRSVFVKQFTSYVRLLYHEFVVT